MTKFAVRPDIKVEFDSAEPELVARTIHDQSDALDYWLSATTDLMADPNVTTRVRKHLMRTIEGVNSILGYN